MASTPGRDQSRLSVSSKTETYPQRPESRMIGQSASSTESTPLEYGRRASGARTPVVWPMTASVCAYSSRRRHDGTLVSSG